MTDTYKQQAIDDLKQLVSPGDTLYIVSVHSTRSGKRRVLRVYLFTIVYDRVHDNVLKIVQLDYKIAAVLGLKLSTRFDGVETGGNGLDVGFELVSRLAKELYGDEIALKHHWL